MACGWHRGYFGMQVNSESERRIIFSVWDSGNEAVDRAKVDDVNRVKLMRRQLWTSKLKNSLRALHEENFRYNSLFQ
jgi:hypothetical protein